MDLDDDQDNESIPNGEVLKIANNILTLLEYPEKIANEDDLFSDEFYITILNNLLTEKKFDIQPGETDEEKVDNLKKLIQLLSEIIEIDLSQISAEGIIMEHDKASAKSFLELLEELIKTLMNGNLDEEESDNGNENKEEESMNKSKSNKKENEEELKNVSYSDNNDSNYIKANNSEGNVFGGNKTKFHLDNLENEENEINEKYSNKKGLNKDEEINIDDLKKEQEKEEKKLSSNKKEEQDNNEDINENELNDNNMNSSNEEVRISTESFMRLNQSNIEQLQLEKMFKKLENKNDESYIRKTYSQNDLSAYEAQLKEREEENENEGEGEGEEENEMEGEKSTENDKKQKKEMLSSPEDEENKFQDGDIDLNYNIEDKNNLSASPIMNVSHISELSQDKSKNKENERSSEKRENAEENSEYNNRSNKNKSNKSSSKKNINIEGVESSSKKNVEDDIPDLLIEKDKKNTISNKFEYDDEDEEEKMKKEYKNNNNYFDSNEDESNLEGDEENYYIPHSVPRGYNKLQLPSASKISESSSGSKKKRAILKESNSSLTNSNISFHSKNSKKSSNKNIDEYNDISNTSNKKESKGVNTNKNSMKKSDKISTNKKKPPITGSKSDKSKRSQRQSEDNDESISDISQSSVYSNPHEKSVKSVKSSGSKKSETSKKNKSTTSGKNKDLNISKKSNKSFKKNNLNNFIDIEIPISDEEIKNEIKKELKRLYGEKAKKYFDKNFLELIIENIKLARKTILKMETGVEPDDNFSKEFLIKYQKEIQKILKYYIQEKKRENTYKQNAIMSIGQNIKFIKKLKEVELKDIENEIEYKKNERNMRNEEEQNQIMLYPSYCYELQKQIYLAETQNQIELNNAIEEEKKKSILESEKYYNDRIAILYELLRRERRERISQKRLNERLDYELKGMNKRKLKKQVEDMLDQIDEEDKKNNDDDNNNQEEIEKILNNFY